MVFCAKCGKKLNEGARFCPRCGAPAGGSREARALPFRSQEAAVPVRFPGIRRGQMRDLSREFQESDVEQNKLMAVLSYFSLLVLLPIPCAKDSKYARFHANQGLMLLLVSMGWQLAHLQC
ncbi:MAG: zinc-ribbon domain-containing protein [Clostridium sp.]